MVRVYFFSPKANKILELYLELVPPGESQRLIGKWENSNDSRITSLEWLNAHDESLILVGSDDGSLRAWKPDYEKGKPK